MKHFGAATLLGGTQTVRCRSRPVGMKMVDLLQGPEAKHYLKLTAINGRFDLSRQACYPVPVPTSAIFRPLPSIGMEG